MTDYVAHNTGEQLEERRNISPTVELRLVQQSQATGEPNHWSFFLFP